MFYAKQVILFHGDAIDLRRGRWASDRQVHDAKDQLTPGQLEELNDNIKALGATGGAWNQKNPVTLCYPLVKQDSELENHACLIVKSSINGYKWQFSIAALPEGILHENHWIYTMQLDTFHHSYTSYPTYMVMKIPNIDTHSWVSPNIQYMPQMAIWLWEQDPRWTRIIKR